MLRTVCVLGLGFVGSAMSTVVASATNGNGDKLYRVVGVDLPNTQGEIRVASLNAGIFPFECSDLELVNQTQKCVNEGNLYACTDEGEISSADVVLVDINMNVTMEGGEVFADFKTFEKAIISIGKNVQRGALIIVETTVPPGTCEHFVAPILATEFKKRGFTINDIHLAHSFERVMPGPQYLQSITNYWRVYSGLTDASKKKCAEFLSTIIDVSAFPLTCLSNMTASESAKIIENTYRAVNIALMDEWGKFAEDVGVDAFEIVNAIKMRPTHSNMMRPGLGVGGYCLTKDLLFGEVSMKKFFDTDRNEFALSKLAYKINQDTPRRNLQRLKSSLGGALHNKRLLVMGVAYRSEVGDTRYSAVETFYSDAIAQGAEVKLHDPFVGFWNELQIEVPKKIPKIENFDVVVFCVPHKIYQSLDMISWLGKERPLVFDCDNVLALTEINKLVDAGVRVVTTGRGPF